MYKDDDGGRLVEWKRAKSSIQVSLFCMMRRKNNVKESHSCGNEAECCRDKCVDCRLCAEELSGINLFLYCIMRCNNNVKVSM